MSDTISLTQKAEELADPFAGSAPDISANRTVKSTSADNKVSYLQFYSDKNYFNTAEQIKIKKETYFTDLTDVPSFISSENRAIGFFSGKKIIHDAEIYNSPSFATSSTVIDSSGNSRPILAANIDQSLSSSIDVYRQGVEIRDEVHRSRGIYKIYAGTAGHLYEKNSYGINELDIIDADKYFEVEVFDPIKFVESGGDPEQFTYPIITSNTNQLENYTLNGIIEPFPIRSVISNFSINFPFEPHAFRGNYGNGNMNHRFASSEVLSVDYFEPEKINRNMFLDAADFVGLIDNSNANGAHIGYLLLDENTVSPFEDIVPPRGQIPSSSYPNDLLNAVYSMLPEGISYVTRKQKSATCGFIFDNTFEGTDSIAYGGLLY